MRACAYKAALASAKTDLADARTEELSHPDLGNTSSQRSRPFMRMADQTRLDL